ncbi:MAG: MBL fold metallo-hydrolase [Oligoflexus sp.]
MATQFSEELLLRSKLTPPGGNQFELCIFGRGVGESILLHLGESKFLVVDSFKRFKSKQPVVLEYLEHIGLGADAIEIIVVSHWHDDHIRGVSDMVEQCKFATIYVPSAVQSKEFISLLATFTSCPALATHFTSGVFEMERCLGFLESEVKAGNPLRLKFASANTNIFRDKAGTVDALSPSTMENLDALAEYLALMPDDKKPGTRGLLRPTNPNNCAIALWVELFGKRVILGSDLEERNDVNRGWTAVCGLNPQPMMVAGVHKIPHHGSETAHHQPVWDNYVNREGLSLLTPYARGVSKLPRTGDVERLKFLSNNVFCTSDPSHELKVRERPSKVERMAQSRVKAKIVVDSKLGMIRVRGDSSADVQLFGASLTL